MSIYDTPAPPRAPHPDYLPRDKETRDAMFWTHGRRIAAWQAEIDYLQRRRTTARKLKR